MEETAFWIKKILSFCVYPMSWALIFMALALITLIFRKSRNWAVLFTALAASSLIVFSVELTSYHLSRSLETQAGRFQEPSELHRKGVKYIVVMGGSIVEEGSTPADSWGQAILRVMEGTRLARGIDGAKLVLSGASYPGRQSVASAMRRLPEELGLHRDSILIMTSAFDSEDEVRVFKTLVGNEPFGLVTSAIHMPRSMKIFKKYGVSPIPCPCDFKTLQGPRHFSGYIPNPGNLLDSSLAIHEYVGMFWMDVKQLIKH